MTGWIGRTLSWFGGSVGVAHARDNIEIATALNTEAVRVFDKHLYEDTDSFEYALSLTVDVIETLGLPLTHEIIKSLTGCIEQLVISNAILPPEINWSLVDHEGDEGRHMRRYLERHKRFHTNHAINDRRFRQGLIQLFASLLSDLPPIPLDVGSAAGFGVKLGQLIPEVRSSVDLLVGNAFNNDLQEARLFEDLRQRFEQNIYSVSGIDYRNQPRNPQRFCMPRDYSGNREDLFDGYLSHTPFKALLQTTLPFSLPSQSRFEHTHIVGGTGHGKTQLLSQLILQDLGDILGGAHKSLVAIDSQGDLIRKISSMAVFNPTNIVGLADKLVVIDPADVEYPTALNIFSINKERLEQYGAVERERVFNGAVELYEHFFKGLLGAELTAKQGVAFTYMSRMMLELEGATIHTLRDLMDNPHAFKDRFANLSASTKMFYERELLSKAYNQTRRQISQRLWGVLSIPAFERMFGQNEHKVDLFELLNSGKIILINTSKDLLKSDGSAIFGKFFLASIAQAIGERAVLAEAERTDTIIYLDEAHEYADESLEVLLNQGRKYRAGIVIAHQFLDQLNGQTRQTLLANASVKIVGGLSHKDNQTFAKEMNTDTDFLSSLRKQESGTEFGLWVKNVIPETLRLTVPFGVLESAKLLDQSGQQALRDQNRQLYCVPAKPAGLPSPETVEVPQDAVSPDVVTEGRGGTQHRDIQQLIKSIGHDFGFGVEVEAPCKQSGGAIDVLLSGEQTIIAVEVSVTTGAEHELENLKKCLNENTDQVLCVSPDDAHRLDIQNLCIERLSQSQLKRITFLNPQSVSDFVSQFDERETTLIRGYEVITKITKSDPRDVEYRKSRIRQVLDGKLK